MWGAGQAGVLESWALVPATPALPEWAGFPCIHVPSPLSSESLSAAVSVPRGWGSPGHRAPGVSDLKSLKCRLCGHLSTCSVQPSGRARSQPPISNAPMPIFPFLPSPSGFSPHRRPSPPPPSLPPFLQKGPGGECRCVCAVCSGLHGECGWNSHCVVKGPPPGPVRPQRLSRIGPVREHGPLLQEILPGQCFSQGEDAPSSPEGWAGRLSGWGPCGLTGDRFQNKSTLQPHLHS